MLITITQTQKITNACDSSCNWQSCFLRWL